MVCAIAFKDTRIHPRRLARRIAAPASTFAPGMAIAIRQRAGACAPRGTREWTAPSLFALTAAQGTGPAALTAIAYVTRDGHLMPATCQPVPPTALGTALALAAPVSVNLGMAGQPARRRLPQPTHHPRRAWISTVSFAPDTGRAIQRAVSTGPRRASVTRAGGNPFATGGADVSETAAAMERVSQPMSAAVTSMKMEHARAFQSGVARTAPPLLLSQPPTPLRSARPAQNRLVAQWPLVLAAEAALPVSVIVILASSASTAPLFPGRSPPDRAMPPASVRI